MAVDYARLNGQHADEVGAASLMQCTRGHYNNIACFYIAELHGPAYGEFELGIIIAIPLVE